MKAWVLVIVAFAGAMFFNVRARQALQEPAAPSARRGPQAAWNFDSAHSLATSVVWSVRQSLAILAWAEAQTYFHCGFDLTVFSRNPEAEKRLGDRHGHECEQDHEHGPECGHDHGHEHGPECTHGHDHGTSEPELRIHSEDEERHIHSLENHPFLRRSALRPYVYEHSHARMGVIEMMPWYWLTAKLDPSFVRAFTNGAYWLAFRLEREDEAMQFLEEGLDKNPQSYEIHHQMGHILFSVRKAYDRAIPWLEKAAALNPAATEEQVDDLGETLRYLAHSYLQSGDPNSAIDTCYKAWRINRDYLGFETVISDATKALEGHPD